MTDKARAIFKLNTAISYLVRSLIFAQLAYFWILSRTPPINMSSAERMAGVMQALSVVIAALLILDWTTGKAPSRRFAKQVDTVLGIGWLLVNGAIFIYSLSMGTL
jgi:hypothetical protein